MLATFNAGFAPQRFDPHGAVAFYIIGCGEQIGYVHLVQSLSDKRGFAHLPRPENDLDESSRFKNPTFNLLKIWSLHNI